MHADTSSDYLDESISDAMLVDKTGYQKNDEVHLHSALNREEYSTVYDKSTKVFYHFGSDDLYTAQRFMIVKPCIVNSAREIFVIC